jgi:ABC-type transport system substrate-binding protein
MLKKSFLLVALGLFLSLSFFMPIKSFGENIKEESPQYGGVFRLKSFSNSFRPEFDPIKAESYIFLSEQIFDGLVKLDKNFNIVPSLAEYWEISPDGKTYTFYLRRGVKFHDGSQLTAADVKFSFERILNKETSSPFYEIFLSKVVGAEDYRAGRNEHVNGFKIRDDLVIEIHWTKPYVSALYLLSMHFCKILPQQLVFGQGERFFSKPFGSGPFKFDSFIRDSKMEAVGVRLSRNEDYFLGKPYLDAVEFCPHFTLDQFMKADIDSFPLVTESLLNSDYQIFQDGSHLSLFLGMSCHIPPLDRTEVRKAIFYALDKEKIVQSIPDIRYTRQVTHNFIPHKLPGFYPTEDMGVIDLTKARELFRSAGYDEAHNFLPLNLFLPLPRTETTSKIYKELRRQLTELGIQIKLRYYEHIEETREEKEPFLFVIGRLMSMPDPEDFIRPYFFSKSYLNVFGYANDSLDSLLQQAETEPSWTNRINLFHRIEQILFSDMPAVPLFIQQNKVVMQPYIRGVEVHPLGFYYLETRKIWLAK